MLSMVKKKYSGTRNENEQYLYNRTVMWHQIRKLLIVYLVSLQKQASDPSEMVHVYLITFIIRVKSYLGVSNETPDSRINALRHSKQWYHNEVRDGDIVAIAFKHMVREPIKWWWQQTLVADLGDIWLRLYMHVIYCIWRPADCCFNFYFSQ